MSNSILTSTKAGLGLPDAHAAFDQELIMHINSVLSTLTQIGVGPAQGFMITSSQEIWSDFIGVEKELNAVKSYMFLRVKLLFDPPDIGFVLTAMKDQIKELEWRLNVSADTKPIQEEVTNAYYNSAAQGYL